MSRYQFNCYLIPYAYTYVRLRIDIARRAHRQD
jgi:hypothetical protein